ncbi:hypothetical protein A3D88_04230 [Candidatus Peribacteria bacterium RIFCSPHIGHO2_02_FULL_52_16]|nr:MAG: hypothetical protein A2706_00975 [Candidatus Peribacteria bacterium RIFCSPHIGHO2_01_FULL_51_35]OGJ60821.1 MAG: hypothetical protein A3D88_04230 [Candidatus Peribacteria bacterium RIFCSPHIGHO2_02_FULL_52_16]
MALLESVPTLVCLCTRRKNKFVFVWGKSLARREPLLGAGTLRRLYAEQNGRLTAEAGRGEK